MTLKRRVWMLSVLVIVLIGAWLGVREYENKQVEKSEEQKASAVITAYLEQLATVSYKQDDLFAKADQYLVPASIGMDHGTQQWFVDRFKEHKLIGQKMTELKLVFKEHQGNSCVVIVTAIYMTHNDKMNYPEQVNYEELFGVTKQPDGTYKISAIMPNTLGSEHA